MPRAASHDDVSEALVLLPTSATEDDVMAALADGACAVVLSDESETFVPAKQPSTTQLPLTDREVQVLRLVADGKSNDAIGTELGLSPATVKVHLARIGRKLGTGNRAHMVLIGLRRGVIE